MAVIPIHGVISMKMVEPYLDIIEKAEKAKKIKGVILKLSSQGGSITATEVLYMALMRLKEVKPLYVWTTLAASGGYYAACASEKIIAPKTAFVGSIGVISIKPVIRDALKMVGITVEVTKEGRLKDESYFFDESSPEGKEKSAAINREIYDDFIDVVKEHRGLDDEEIETVATGEIFTARRGVDLGLVDEISDFRGGIEALGEKVGVDPKKYVVLKIKKPFLSSILDRGVRAGFSAIMEDIFSPEMYYI